MKSTCVASNAIDLSHKREKQTTVVGRLEKPLSWEYLRAKKTVEQRERGEIMYEHESIQPERRMAF